MMIIIMNYDDYDDDDDDDNLTKPMSYMCCQVTFRQCVLRLKYKILHPGDDDCEI